MRKGFACAAAAALLLSGGAKVTALAGGINGNEASVIAVAGGTFEYQGKLYVAKAEYQAQLYAKLSEDGIDLTADQAAEGISMIYANVATGVNGGYLAEVAGDDEGETEQPDTEEKKKNKKKTEKAKEETTDQSAAQEEQTAVPQESQGSETPPSEEASAGETGSESESETINFQEYDIEEIEKKDPGQRTEEEQKAYDQYIAKKAVDDLRLGEDETEKTDDSSQKQWASDREPDLFNKLQKPLTIAGILLAALMAGAFMIRQTIIYRRRKKNQAYLPDTFTDIHSHVLPGADDGAPDKETSMRMIDKAYQEGIRCMIATPHYCSSKHHLRVEEVQKIYRELSAEAEKKYPDFRLLPGNEIFYTEGTLEKLEKGRALTLGESRYVLIEFSPEESCRNIQRAVVSLLRECYLPVLAHTERYKDLVKDLTRVQELREMGALVQINANGGKGALRLWRADCVDLIATDCHDLKRRNANLGRSLQKLCAYGNKEQLHRVLTENPGRITNGKRQKEN